MQSAAGRTDLTEDIDVFADARLTNLIANLLALLAVGAIVAGAVYWVISRPYFVVARIEIAPMQGPSLQYVTPVSMRTSLAGQIRGSRSEEHTSELQSLMRISYAVFCLKQKTKTT